MDSAGPWAVWLAIGVVMIVAVGVMLDANVGIEDRAPSAVVASLPSGPAH